MRAQERRNTIDSSQTNRNIGFWEVLMKRGNATKNEPERTALVEKKIDVQIDPQPSPVRITIRFELVIVLSCLHLNALVRRFWEVFRECARESLERFLNLLDDRLLAEKPEDHWVRKIYNGRKFTCSLGTLSIRARQVMGEAGRHYYPLLRLLGVRPRQRIVEELVTPVLVACLCCSFRNGRRVIGSPVSVTHIWREFQKRGAEIRHSQEDAVSYYEAGDRETGGSSAVFAIVMLDGIYTKGRLSREERALREKEGLKELAVGKSGRKKKKRSRGREAKVARLVLFSKEQEGDWKPSRVWVQSGYEGSKEFLKRCQRFFDAVAGLHKVPYILVLTDGCSWGRDFCEFYPGRAYWQLDWWHLWRNLKKGTRLSDGLMKKVWDLLNVEKLEEALELLRRALDSSKEYRGLSSRKLREVEGFGELEPLRRSAEKRLDTDIKDLEDVIGYLEKNRGGVYGVKGLVGKVPAEYWLMGTGPVERLQAVMVGYRMKGQGRVWSDQGAVNMLASLQDFWNEETAGPVISCLLEEQEEWESLCRLPTPHIQAEGRGSSPAVVRGLPALQAGITNGTSYVLRRFLRGGYPLDIEKAA
jgi:hypothetical protein